MKTRFAAALLLLVIPFGLAACKREAPKQAAAVGQILPGSISDAMLPEDRLTSKPPLDPAALHTSTSGADKPEATRAPQADRTPIAAETEPTEAAE